MVPFTILDMIFALYGCENDSDLAELWDAFVTLNDFGLISSAHWTFLMYFYLSLFDAGKLPTE